MYETIFLIIGKIMVICIKMQTCEVSVVSI